MRQLRPRIANAAIVFLGVTVFSASSASAQNTYADFPFNQGSLFYRPSGLKPPRPRVVSAPRYIVAAPTYVTTAPAAPVYVVPSAAPVYYARPRLFRNRYFVRSY